MENFNWKSFTKKIAVKALLSEIYNAWVVPEAIETWFLREARYYNEADVLVEKGINIKENYIYEWEWHLYDNVEKGRIIKTNGKDFLQFTFADNCLVDVLLKQEGDYVIVTLTQKNIPTDEASKLKIRLGCESGWAFYLLNLKSIYEGGLDLRNKNPELKNMLNC